MAPRAADRVSAVSPRSESGPSTQSNPGGGASAGPTTHPRSFGWGSTVGFERKGADVAPRAAGRVSAVSPRSFLRLFSEKVVSQITFFRPSYTGQRIRNHL